MRRDEVSVCSLIGQLTRARLLARPLVRCAQHVASVLCPFLFLFGSKRYDDYNEGPKMKIISHQRFSYDNNGGRVVGAGLLVRCLLWAWAAGGQRCRVSRGLFGCFISRPAFHLLNQFGEQEGILGENDVRIKRNDWKTTTNHIQTGTATHECWF